MSGGRATVRHQKGKCTDAAVGDICALAPEGHPLCNRFFIETKHVRDLDLVSSLLHGKGQLAKFWSIVRKEAKKHGRTPLLVARQNRLPTLAFLFPANAQIFFGASTDKELFRSFVLEYRGVSVYKFDDLLSDRFVLARFERKCAQS